MGFGEFKEVNKRNNTDSPDQPMVAVRGEAGNMSLGILENAYEKMGEPNGLRVFTHGTSIGLLPDTAEHYNSYKVVTSDNSNQISFAWYKNEADMVPEKGRYPLEYDEEAELWIADLDIKKKNFW